MTRKAVSVVSKRATQVAFVRLLVQVLAGVGVAAAAVGEALSDNPKLTWQAVLAVAASTLFAYFKASPLDVPGEVIPDWMRDSVTPRTEPDPEADEGDPV